MMYQIAFEATKKHELSLGTHSVMTAQLFPKLSSRQRGLWVSPGGCGRGLMGTAAAYEPSCFWPSRLLRASAETRLSKAEGLDGQSMWCV